MPIAENFRVTESDCSHEMRMCSVIVQKVFSRHESKCVISIFPVLLTTIAAVEIKYISNCWLRIPQIEYLQEILWVINSCL